MPFWASAYGTWRYRRSGLPIASPSARGHLGEGQVALAMQLLDRVSLPVERHHADGPPPRRCRARRRGPSSGLGRSAPPFAPSALMTPDGGEVVLEEVAGPEVEAGEARDPHRAAARGRGGRRPDRCLPGDSAPMDESTTAYGTCGRLQSVADRAGRPVLPGADARCRGTAGPGRRRRGRRRTHGARRPCRPPSLGSPPRRAPRRSRACRRCARPRGLASRRRAGAW